MRIKYRHHKVRWLNSNNYNSVYWERFSFICLSHSHFFIWINGKEVGWLSASRREPLGVLPSEERRKSEKQRWFSPRPWAAFCVSNASWPSPTIWPPVGSVFMAHRETFADLLYSRPNFETQTHYSPSAWCVPPRRLTATPMAASWFSQEMGQFVHHPRGRHSPGNMSSDMFFPSTKWRLFAILPQPLWDRNASLNTKVMNEYTTDNPHSLNCVHADAAWGGWRRISEFDN